MLPVSIELLTGLAYYTGDISSTLQIGMQGYLLRPSLSLGVGYRVTPYITLKTDACFFLLKARGTHSAWKNHAFYSNCQEATVMLVHEFYSKREAEDNIRSAFPYFFIGGGLLRYMPRVPKSGLYWEDILRANKNYEIGRQTWCVPIGLGFNYYLMEDTWIGVEAGYRLTGTDFLDGAGSPFSQANDGYFIYGVKAGIQLRNRWRYAGYLLR